MGRQARSPMQFPEGNVRLRADQGLYLADKQTGLRRYRFSHDKLNDLCLAKQQMDAQRNSEGVSGEKLVMSALLPLLVIASHACNTASAAMEAGRGVGTDS